MTKEACSGYAAERLMANPGEGVQTEFEVEDDFNWTALTAFAENMEPGILL